MGKQSVYSLGVSRWGFLLILTPPSLTKFFRLIMEINMSCRSMVADKDAILAGFTQLSNWGSVFAQD